MIAEAIRAIRELADETQKQRGVFRLEDDPPHVYRKIDADGDVLTVEAEPPPDRSEPADLDSVVRLAKEYHECGDHPAEVWYSRAAVVVVSGRDRATLKLSPSPQMAALRGFESAGVKVVSQAEFVLVLRTLFANCAPESLLPAVRQVRSSRGGSVDSQIQQGKVSLSKSIVAEMTGLSAIPEQVVLSVPVFAQANVPVVRQVRLVIDPDPQNDTFRLYTIPGDIEAAFAEAEAVVRHRLADLLGDAGESIPLYLGTPTP